MKIWLIIDAEGRYLQQQWNNWRTDGPGMDVWFDNLCCIATRSRGLTPCFKSEVDALIALPAYEARGFNNLSVVEEEL